MAAFWSSARVNSRDEPAREHEFFSRVRTNFRGDFLSPPLHLPLYPRGENREFGFRRGAIQARTRIENSSLIIIESLENLRDFLANEPRDVASTRRRVPSERTFRIRDDCGSKLHCRVRRLDAPLDRPAKKTSISALPASLGQPSRRSIESPRQKWRTTKSQLSQRPHRRLSAFIPFA
jgi:hypothetical protein